VPTETLETPLQRSRSPSNPKIEPLREMEIAIKQKPIVEKSKSKPMIDFSKLLLHKKKTSEKSTNVLKYNHVKSS
jgi:hypothetical protein